MMVAAAVANSAILHGMGKVFATDVEHAKAYRVLGTRQANGMQPW